MQDLAPFFAARHFIENHEPDSYEPQQWGRAVMTPVDPMADWTDADIILIGCGERRGSEPGSAYSTAPDAVREAFYNTYCWHSGVKIYDAGNILQGKSADDTRAALRMVLHEIRIAGKTAIVIGGSHDLMLQQYEAYKLEKQAVTAVGADMRVDLEEAEGVTDRSFLFELLTTQPNYVRHYSHLGFQSYATHPGTLETLDKLRFDFFRLGRLRESMEEAEPVLRNADIFGFDLSCVRYSDAPSNINGSPNGFTGDEACLLARYAGMSAQLHSLGLYQYMPEHDQFGMTAQLIAQMLWYFIDGYGVRRIEAPLEKRDEFSEFHVSFTSNDVLFLKSKRTARWWMQIPDGRFVPCSYADYRLACNDEMPERWLREQERLV
jgi:arginase family enzyme